MGAVEIRSGVLSVRDMGRRVDSLRLRLVGGDDLPGLAHLSHRAKVARLITDTEVRRRRQLVILLPFIRGTLLSMPRQDYFASFDPTRMGATLLILGGFGLATGLIYGLLRSRS